MKFENNIFEYAMRFFFYQHPVNFLWQISDLDFFAIYEGS